MNQWSTENRFSQTGYSAPTIFPLKENYDDEEAYSIDLAKAELREESHLDWLFEQQQEQRREWLEMQAEIKAEREEWA